MLYKFCTYSSSKVKIEKRSLLNAVEFSDEHNKAEREKALLTQALSSTQNNSTKLYSLRDSSLYLKGILGFIALSASEVMLDDTKKPVVLIDLLFVNKKYRSTIYEHLDNSRISQLLLEYAISKFYEVREHIGVSYLILYPDGGKENSDLVNFYKSMGFSYATNKHEWMYIKL
jgi:hypothetical protein